MSSPSVIAKLMQPSATKYHKVRKHMQAYKTLKL